MTSLTRDRDYATFVEDERPLLQRCAYLLVGRRAPADDLVEATLAEAYARWPRVRDPRLVALRLLHTTDLGALPTTASRSRFELVDAQPAHTHEVVDPLVTVLGELSARQRLVVVLEWVARLPTIEIAAVLDSSVQTVSAIARDARTALERAAPELADDKVLAARLDAAVPPDVRSVRRYDDLVRGRELVRRRWLHRAGALAAAVAVLALLVTQLRPVAQPVSAPAPAPAVATVTVSPRPVTPCDRSQATCRASLTRTWRATVAEVVADYLDPEGSYFNASSHYPRDETDGLWETKHGALAMEVFRVGGGATQVYVQVATDRSYAPRCGAATGSTCTSMRAMDGNLYTLSDTGDAAEGLEGQYRPDDDAVITVVARDSGSGSTLPVTRADLVRLLQDERLRLPDR